MAAHDAAFDKIMELAGDDGPFQKRFNLIFNAAMVVFGGMSFMNIILALNVPDHWCYVSGREHTNYTMEQWKNLTLPREVDVRGISTFSKCKMYDINWTTIQSWDYENWNSTNRQQQQLGLGVKECDVREFDKQWYESTIVSQEDWVCSKDLYKTNTFVLNRIGEVIGTFIFGQLGDRLGRRIIYYLSIIAILVGRVLIMTTTSYHTWFGISSVIGSLCAISLFQSPFIIAMEISKPDNRATVAVIQNFSWAAGMCILPLVYWWTRTWQAFFILTTAPLALFLFFPKYMIESPRWLANRGKLDKASIYLNRIAKINGKATNINEKLLQSMLPTKGPEKVFGIISLFSGLRLAKNTTILVICWMTSALAYFTLILYIAQTGGNPFLNFFIQSVAEVPAYFLGTYMANTLGRRWTSSISFLLAAAFCIPTALLTNFQTVELMSHRDYPPWAGNKINNWCTMYRSYIAFTYKLVLSFLSDGAFFALISGIKFDSRYPIVILCALFVFGGIFGLFLPETLHQKLPDSLEEARKFGADQKFWSYPKNGTKQQISNDTIEEMEKLNATP